MWKTPKMPKKRKNLKPAAPKFPPYKPHIESNYYGDRVVIVRIPEKSDRETAQGAIKQMWSIADSISPKRIRDEEYYL